MWLVQFVKFQNYWNKMDVCSKAQKISEYLTKSFYSIPQNENQQFILNIDNKGEKDNFAVSNIRVDKLNGADEIIVSTCIADCLNQKQNIVSTTDDKPELPSDFRQEIYSAWFENCENKNIALKLYRTIITKIFFVPLGKRQFNF